MSSQPPGRSRRYLAIAIAVLVALAAGGWWYWKGAGTSEAARDGKAAAKAPAKGGGRFGVDPNRAQPVAAAPVRKGELRIVQSALGTISAGRTVTVKPRVDGVLVEVLFREGQIVKEGDLLARIDPAPFQVAVEQAEGALARDTAMLANAKNDLERFRSLVAKGMVSAQQVDATEALVRQHEGSIKVDRAVLENAKLQLGYTRVVAPISGRLGLRLVDAGNLVRSSDSGGLVVITQVDPVAAIFTIPQDTLPRVLAQLRDGKRIEVEAWDREQKEKLGIGALLSTDNQVDTTTGTVKLKAQFPNPEGRLFPNQFVNVRMVVDTRRDATLVPAAAIQRGPQGTVAFVVKDDGTVGLRPVATGPTEGAMIAIERGLEPGERVVTDGLDRLREGAKVEVMQPGGRGGGGRPPPASKGGADAPKPGAKGP
jgi:multidrug efflux system membrane fusion protein